MKYIFDSEKLTEIHSPVVPEKADVHLKVYKPRTSSPVSFVVEKQEQKLASDRTGGCSTNCPPFSIRGHSSEGLSPYSTLQRTDFLLPPLWICTPKRRGFWLV